VDWCEVDRQVRNLRQRIFRATQRGDLKKVRSLQKLMLHSRSNILQSVRRVTQINAGKNTPGVDKLVVKTPAARSQLVDQLLSEQLWRARPVRRVFIPKASNPNKLRPLGIPVVADRCRQAIAKNALEPYWECKFEGTSYGFRPGRSCHDAIEKIYSLARPFGRRKWILDADIKGAFDEISQSKLLSLLKSCPLKGWIERWLKAGVMKDGRYEDTPNGVPQGGVISPLLLNIALHGMEEALELKYNRAGATISSRAVVRFADDFTVFCETQEDAEQTQEILAGWLAERGLVFSEEKTRIVHLTEGFNFLGFNIRLYKHPKSTKSGYKLLIKPSKEARLKIRYKLREHWKQLVGTNALAVVKTLNPIVRGWANYFRVGVAKKIFSQLDHWMYQREMRYARRMHPNKAHAWLKKRYFGKLNLNRDDQWVFGDKASGRYQLKFSWFEIQRHILVRGRASPDDPSLRHYWEDRQCTKAKTLGLNRRKLAQRQHYRCPVCKVSLFNDEDLQQHHLKPRSQGGTDELTNQILVHLYCHQQIHNDKMGKAISKGFLQTG
jgi:RNA-directed DNA polymerase